MDAIVADIYVKKIKKGKCLRGVYYCQRLKKYVNKTQNAWMITVKIIQNHHI